MNAHQLACKYAYSVAWSAENNTYIARVAEFPSLAANGDTMNSALDELRSVVRACLEDAEHMEDMPTPHGDKKYSGRLLLRLPSELHRRLADEATQQGIPLNQLLVARLAAGKQSQ